MIAAPSAEQKRQREPRPGGVLITGATGFIGMEVLARFLERSDRRVYLLVRAADEREARERARSSVACLFGTPDAHADRFVAVPGDIQQPNLGLDARRRLALAEEVTDVVHSAASVSFSLPLDRSRDINVTGTKRMLDFASLCDQRGGMRCFSYISTAYVAGTHRGEFCEEELDVGQSFRNPYERSKFEAEAEVRDRRDEMPIQIFRPSIVVGEQSSGWTSSFNVLYSPLKAFARGSLRAIPARRSSPVDVVPVDYVADAVFELANNRPAPSETFHLVAGEAATTVGELIDLSANRLDQRAPIVLPPPLYRRLVDPVLARCGAASLKSAVERMRVFFPYFAMDVAYRNDRARSRLEPAGVRAPAIESYFDRLLDFAVESKWGRVPIGRAEAANGRPVSIDAI